MYSEKNQTNKQKTRPVNNSAVPIKVSQLSLSLSCLLILEKRYLGKLEAKRKSSPFLFRFESNTNRGMKIT